MIDPKNQERIEQWIHWNELARTQPEKFRVVRVGIDFMLMMRLDYYPNCWVTACMCSELKHTPQLRLV